MSTHNLTIAPVNCHVGTFIQQFKCGYNQGRSGHVPSMAQAFTGGVLPVLVIVAFVALILIIRSAEKRHRASAAPVPARVPRYARR